MNRTTVGIIIIVILGFFYYQRSSNDNLGHDRGAKSRDGDEKLPHGITVSQPKLGAPNPKKASNEVISYTKRRVSGIRIMPVTKRDEKIRFNLSFDLLEKGCRLGDVDYIEMNWKPARERNLRLTLESLDSENPQFISKKVTPNAIKKHGKTEFVVKNIQKPRLFGLYLCSGSGKKCQDKKPIDFQKTQKNAMKRGKSSKMPNALYSFTLLRIAPGSVAAVPTDQEKFSHLRAVFPNEKKRLLRSVNGISKVLKNYLVELEDGTVKMKMTGRSTSCRFSSKTKRGE